MGTPPTNRDRALAEPTLQSGREAPKGDEWWGTVLPPGAVLAQRYRIDRFIKRGGMGEVYEVWDSVLGERIALKTVASPCVDNPEAVEQLKAEVQLARRVSHRNVCNVHDLGTHERSDGSELIFLSMEFVDGETLGEYIQREGRSETGFALHLARGILAGLQAAHEAGVLHRDLKTDNVMLRRNPAGPPTPVLMDFGLASALNPNSSRVSSEDALVGSLAYMAPEQVQGEPLRVATDLYAFGVILFEMLAGRRPFEASTPALSALKRLQEPAPLLRQIDDRISRDLEAIVQRCLERDPRRRFRSARELRALISHGASQTDPAAPWERVPPNSTQAGSLGRSPDPRADTPPIGASAEGPARTTQTSAEDDNRAPTAISHPRAARDADSQMAIARGSLDPAPPPKSARRYLAPGAVLALLIGLAVLGGLEPSPRPASRELPPPPSGGPEPAAAAEASGAAIQRSRPDTAITASADTTAPRDQGTSSTPTTPQQATQRPMSEAPRPSRRRPLQNQRPNQEQRALPVALQSPTGARRKSPTAPASGPQPATANPRPDVSAPSDPQSQASPKTLTPSASAASSSPTSVTRQCPVGLLCPERLGGR